MADDIITTAVEAWERLSSEDEVRVKFKKKDGTIRYMKCTLNFDKIPKSKVPKSVNVARIVKTMSMKKIIHVFDLEKNDWRSLPLDRAEWLDTGEKRYKIKL